jgi:hypothetical protein
MPQKLLKHKASEPRLKAIEDAVMVCVTIAQANPQLKVLAKTAGLKDNASFLLVSRKNSTLLQQFQNNDAVLKTMKDNAKKEINKDPDHIVLVDSNAFPEEQKPIAKAETESQEDPQKLKEMIEKLRLENKELAESAEEATSLHTKACESLKKAAERNDELLKKANANPKMPKTDVKKEHAEDDRTKAGQAEENKPKATSGKGQEPSNEKEAKEDRQTNQTKSKFVANPGKFQLKTWRNDEQIDFWEHLSRNRIAIKNAKQAGLTDSQLISLFMLTLRPEDGFLDELIEDEERTDFETFLESIGRYLSGSTSSMMNNMITTKRRPSESLIAFFIRLCSMYKTSSGKNPKSPEAAGFLHPIIVNNATKIQKTELIRELEAVERGREHVTFEALKSACKKAQIMDSSNYADAPVDLIYNIESPKGRQEDDKQGSLSRENAKTSTEKTDDPQRWQTRRWEDRPRRAWSSRPERGWNREPRRDDRTDYRAEKRYNRFEGRPGDNRRDPLCYNCSNRGHMWRECSKPLKERFVRLQQANKDREASQREVKTPSGIDSKK